MSTSYVTDKDALAVLLPPGFEPADEPVVTVFYQKRDKVNFLAGGAYNLMGVNVAVFFNGERDQVKGNYALMLWEDNGSPIGITAPLFWSGASLHRR